MEKTHIVVQKYSKLGHWYKFLLKPGWMGVLEQPALAESVSAHGRGLDLGPFQPKLLFYCMKGLCFHEEMQTPLPIFISKYSSDSFNYFQ